MITKEEESWINRRKNWKWKIAMAPIAQKNWKTNEDTCENLDTSVQRDHKVIREYLNDAPVWFGEREVKTGMNNSEMMGSEESNWKILLKCFGWVWKEFSQSKTIMRGWQQVRTMNLEENGARLREKSSSVFKSENDDKKHHHELLRYSGMTNRKVEPMMKMIWQILEEDIWLMTVHSYVKLWKEFEKLR